jgi:hypothetical protein
VKPTAEVITEDVVPPTQTASIITAEPQKTEKKGLLAKRSKSDKTSNQSNEKSDDNTSRRIKKKSEARSCNKTRGR